MRSRSYGFDEDILDISEDNIKRNNEIEEERTKRNQNFGPKFHFFRESSFSFFEVIYFN